MVRSTWRSWRRPARWVGATLARCCIRASLVCVLLGVLVPAGDGPGGHSLSGEGRSSSRLSGAIRGNHRRRRTGGAAPHSFDDGQPHCRPAHRRLSDALSPDRGALSGHEQQRSPQRLPGGLARQSHDGRCPLELRDGSAAAVGERRTGAGIRLTRDRRPSGVGPVEERGVRHDVRADRHRLQQATRRSGRDSAVAHRFGASAHRQARPIRRQGRDI